MLPKDKFICMQEDELMLVAEKLLQKYPSQRIFALDGVMGVGKTTFMKYICRYLHSTDTISSPTFSIVNEYTLPQKDILYHFDFYRIKNLREALEIGLEEYFYSNRYCFIEWAENIEKLLPPETIHVEIRTENPLGNGNRIFIF